MSLHTYPQSVCVVGGRPSTPYCFFGSQEDNLFYSDSHHTRVTYPLRLHTRTVECGNPIRQATAEPVFLSLPGHYRSPTSSASSRTGTSAISYPIAPSLPLSNSSTSSSSGGPRVLGILLARMEAGQNCGRGKWCGLDPTQMYYVTSYSAAEFRTFYC